MTPFTLHTKVADALAARPELREILPAFHPAFARLNHPMLGKILPRLVTLEQAAHVAGVEPDALLEVCNLPGAPTHRGPELPRRMDPAPPWPADAPIVEVDAVPVIEAGGEPFAAIMDALRAVPVGGVARVRAPFEPSPLLALLGKRGWIAHVTWEGDVCLASFWRPPAADAPTAQAVELDARLRDGVLDVTDLAPPEPMRLVLAALDAGHLPLTVRHHREPALLFPKLQERGLVWQVTPTDGAVMIEIHRP